MKKKIIFIIILWIILIAISPSVHAADCTNFKKGDGSENNPYQITNNLELYSINCHLDSHFILMNDLDLSDDTGNAMGVFYNDGNGWVSIGNKSVFSGVFDGNNKKISGLKQERTFDSSELNGNNYGGLFRNVSGTIKNLYLEDIYIRFNENYNVGVIIGAIAAYSSGTIINNKVSGTIIYTGNMENLSGYMPYNIGGIIGYAESGNIEKNTNDANIKVDSTISGEVGGIVSYLRKGKINECINKGNVTGNQDAGGIIDRVSNFDDEYIEINNCKNYGEIKADYVGGIATTIAGNIKILNCSNHGTIESKDVGGGIASLAVLSGTNTHSYIEKCYNTGTINTQKNAGGIVGSSNSSEIKDSYNVGTINARDEYFNRNIGGIVGRASNTSGDIAKIVNTYNVGKINYSDKAANVGNIVGNANCDVLNSYYMINQIPSVGKLNDPNVAGSGIDESIGLTARQLKNKENYLGFDFENVWDIRQNDTYYLPQIKSNSMEKGVIYKISLSIDKTIYINDMTKINLSIIPNNIECGNIIWSVINETGEGTITEDGTFKGTKAGKVTVVATSENNPFIFGELELNILPVHIEKIKINNNLTTASLNNEYEMSATIIPSNTTNKNIVWSVINGTGEGTITEDGIFKGTKNGTVTIMATSEDNSEVKDFIDVEIVNVNLNAIKIITSTSYMSMGTSAYLHAVTIPSNASAKDVVWSSSDTSIASINASTGGLATKSKVGMVNITATSKTNPEISDTFKLYVGYANIKVGQTTAIGNSSYITYKDVIWDIEDESIISSTGVSGYTSINNYYKHYINVTGIKNGTTTVTMKTISGDILATSQVYVYTSIDSLSANYEELNLIKDETKNINVNIQPENISENLNSIVYTSSNDDVVSINQDGEAIAHNNGSTNIKIYSQYSDVVLNIPVNVGAFSTDLLLESAILNLNDDKRTDQIIYEVLPEDATNKNVTFESSDSSIATVSDTGLVTAIKNGTATITINTEDGRQTKDITVNVSGLRKDITKLILPNFSDVVYNGNPQQREFTIKDGDYTLIENTDYTVTYENNTNVGTAKIIIAGINNYKNSKELNFNITKANISVTDNSSDINIKYDGKPHTIITSFSVSSNAKIKYMDENNDYTLDTVPEYSEVGKYIIKYKIYIDSNYTEYYDQKTLTITEVQINFADVPNDSWYYDAVKEAYARNIISGYSKTTFAPNDKVTRGQLVTFLYRLEGMPDVSSIENDFNDVEDNMYFTDGVKWAKSNKIVSGYGGTKKFGPNDPIIRQDLAVILNNYAKYKEKDYTSMQDISSFTDYSLVKGNYAEDALKWAVKNKVMSGQNLGNNKRAIAPFNNTSRAEAAAMIVNFINRFEIN